MVEYDGVDGGGGGGGKLVKKVVKKSKNRQRVQRVQRSEKFAKAIGSEERLPKHRSSVNLIRRTRALIVFRALFAGSRSSLDIIFESITTRQSEWSC